MSNSYQPKQFLFCYNKKKSLIDYLLKDLNKYELYHLILVSCYFNLESAKTLIKSLQTESVDITKVSIYIDRGSAIKIGKDNILKWIKETSISLELEINFKIPKTSNLFHAKAYCLLSDDYTDGSLVLGSANLTMKGLINQHCNIETLYNTQDIKHIRDFYEQLNDGSILKFINVSQLEEFDKEDDYYFKYALLQEGFFVQLNDVTLSDLLSFKYKFNQNVQTKTFKEKSKDHKVKTKKDGTVNYFENIISDIESIILKYNANYKIQWGKYGIKTDFGYWIPKHLVSYLEEFESNNIELCKKAIREILEDYIDTAKYEMQEAWNDFFREDWLADNFKYELDLTEAKEHLKNIIKKFLSHLDECLVRYHIVKFDFDFTNSDEIKHLFNILQQSCIKKLGERDYSDLSNNIEDELCKLDSFLIEYDKNDGICANKSTESLIRKCINNHSNMLFKCLALAIISKQLRFIRYLHIDFFINRS